MTSDNICRGCLGKCNPMICLQDSSQEARQIMTKLSSILNKEIVVDHGCPCNCFCSVCEVELNRCYAFQQQCLRSEQFITVPLKQNLILDQEFTSPKPELEVKKKTLVDHTYNKNIVQLETGSERIKEAATFNGEFPWKALSNEDRLGKQKKRLKQYPVEVIQQIKKEMKEKYSSPVTCRMCDFIAKDKRRLSSHMTWLHKGSKESWCQTCNSLEENLSDHLKKYHKDDLKCPLCSKIVKTLSHFMEHISCHTDQHLQKGSSTACNRNNRDPNEALEEPTTRMNLCQYCGKIFSKKSKLTVHMRIHTGEVPYKCSFCDIRVNTRGKLKVHERSHTGERPFACSFCDKRFRQTSNLKAHETIHTGKTTKCIVCSKKFCNSSELRVHMQDHTGEYLFKCKQCDHNFKQRIHLREHLRTHTGERPFQCEFCSRSFRRLDTLQSHVRIHSGEKPFKCTHCPWAARQKSKLKQHLNQRHRDQVVLRVNDSQVDTNHVPVDVSFEERLKIGCRMGEVLEEQSTRITCITTYPKE